MDDTAIQAIIAALHAGAPADAERLCRKQIQLQPGESNVMLLLALSQQQQGKLVEAAELHASLTRMFPDDSLHWSNYATALGMLGDMDAAECAARTAVGLAPDDPERLEQLGLLQVQRGELVLAMDTLLRAFGKAPESPSVRIHAAGACVACRDQRAEDLLRPWREWLPLEDSLQFELADIQAQSGDVTVALEILEDLLSRNPSHRQAQLLLANVYERVNRLDDSKVMLQRIAGQDLELDDHARAEIAHQRAQLAFRAGAVADARVILEQAGPRNGSDCAHYFALAKVCDKAGDIKSAMQALGTAHARQMQEVRHAAPQFFAPGVAATLPHANARVAATDYAKWPDLSAPDAKQSPVFVVGFPRSGTTLLEQMLDAHPRLQSMDERPFFNILANQLDNFGVEVPRGLGKLGQRDCDELRKGYFTLACSKVPRRWDAQLVDKNPLNMLWLPMIHRLYPRAKFILALRHPCDVILSCYMQNFRAAVLAISSESLTQLAKAYVSAMECWLYHVDLFQPDVFVSRYEDLVADTPGQTRRIAQFLELDDSEPMLHFDARAREKGYIATPSYTQVIEPINSKGMNRWHRYRGYFEPVLPILRPMLEHWNYATA